MPSNGMAVSTIVSRVQALLDDPSGQRFESAYVFGYIDQRYEDICSELTSLDLGYEVTEKAISALAANTVNLDAYQAAGGVLDNMLEPLSVEWKLVGQPDTEYKPVNVVDKVVDVSSQEGIRSYEWRDGSIILSPSNVALDVRVRFRGLPTTLDEGSDQTIVGLGNIVAWRVAETIAAINGMMAGSGEALAKYLERKGDAALANFEITAIKRDQVTPRFLGRNSRRRAGPMFRPPTV